MEISPSADLVVRSSLPPAAVAAALRSALKPLAPNLAGNDLRTLQGLVDKSVSPRRFIVLLLGGFALFALVLASLGIYGLISYSVGQRTQEIGIRMALGASARAVQRMVIRQTLWLAAIGMALGTAASWALAGVASGLLFNVTATDPATFAACCWCLRSSPAWPATCRRGALRGSTRWSPCARSRFGTVFFSAAFGGSGPAKSCTLPRASR